MNQKFLQIRDQIEDRILYYKNRIKQRIGKAGPRLFLFVLVFFILSQKDLSINIGFNSAEIATSNLNMQSTAAPVNYTEAAQPTNVSLISSGKKKKERNTETTKKKKSRSKGKDDNLANTYSNMTYTAKGKSAKDSKRTAKRTKQLKYVERFHGIAEKEMDKYGIPASITLAQGLLESNVGESKLAVRNNNHFGMKCFSKSCKKGHCSNFTDDSHKDFFRKYNSAWESYRAHSQLLKNGKRYRNLFKLKSSDYRGWARGLKKAGYATDKYYAEKLINLIEDLDLDEYDN